MNIDAAFAFMRHPVLLDRESVYIGGHHIQCPVFRGD
jgi:hypothetical protein